ncbi:glycosyltransferase family 4 protein [Halomicroarcula sp. GCM10025817]|uniref:glycosyltransferase family 4 protein n=1 Tax=Halomicroarcula sp. GCM10025817 TaxID=3252672 RepID=UPI00361854DE
MVSVLFLVGSVSATSIPVELAIVLARETDTDVTIVPFYDDEPPDGIPGLDAVNVAALGADSRFDLGAFRALWTQLREHRVDILHTHDNFLGSAGRVLGALARRRIVDTEHRAHDSMTTLQNLANAPTLPLSTVVVGNSQTTLDSFGLVERALLSAAQTPTRVIHNGVDVKRVRAATPAEFGAGPTVVCAARFVPVKNHQTLVRAFGRLLEDHPTARLVLAGDGPRRPAIESLVADLRVEDAVRFVGSVSRERVYELYAGADAFAIASRAEGFCVAAVEALAAGLPVVASDIPVFHEVLGDAAAFADPDDPGAFGARLAEMLTASDRAAQLGNASVERAEQFRIERTAREYAAVYNDVLSE